MCGICGVYNYGSGEPVDERLVAQMTAAMTHRGPDDDGFLAAGAVGLGMRRLSIIDLAGGAQPIFNEQRTIAVVQNGEIYNFRELRRELEAYGHVFATRSDTEVIVHAYEQWGLESLRRLNGMFGIAIWDASLRRLVLARDPFGVKPLYYWIRDGRLVFGSEIRPLLHHPAIERRVDRSALREFLRLTYVPGPRTAFEGIRKMVPGHALVCTPEGCEDHRYQRTLPRNRQQVSEPALVHELRLRIERAIERQLVADVPVGVMLSGGIDSATVATIMTKARQEPIATFTVGFEGTFAKNELDAARDTARRIGSDHHEVTISAGEFERFLPKAVLDMEEPVATAQTLPYFKVCELAREHVKVVLTGQGADEPFAGYPRHLGERYSSLYRSLPAALRSEAIAPLVRMLPRNEQLKRAVSSLDVADARDRIRRVYSVIDAPLTDRLLGASNGDGAAAGDDAIALWLADVGRLDDLNKMLYVDARTSLADNLLLYGDKMAMAVSLEARVPFLDLELMAFAEGIPAEYKIRGLTQKRILKRAMSEWLPSEIINRKKIGFQTPIDVWLRNELRATVEERLLSEGSGIRTYLDAPTVRQMLDDHVSGRHDYKRALFSLLTFEIWHDEFIRPTAWPPVADAVASGPRA